MKRLLLLILFMSISVQVNAQKNLNNEEEIQTIFGDGKLSSGGYLAPELKYTQIMSENALMLGGRGGWIINHVFSIGAGGYGLVTSPVIKDCPDSDSILRTGWGGLFLQYTHSSSSLIHFTVNSFIGAGGITRTPTLAQMEKNNDNPNYMEEYEGSGFFIFEPGIGVEVNVFKFFRVELGGSYRVVAGLDMPMVESKDLGTWSVNLALKFGKF